MTVFMVLPSSIDVFHFQSSQLFFPPSITYRRFVWTSWLSLRLKSAWKEGYTDSVGDKSPPSNYDENCFGSGVATSVRFVIAISGIFPCASRLVL